MAESRYEAEKKRACPDGCGKGLQRKVPSTGRAYHGTLEKEWVVNCTAPSEREFAESQAIRAEEAERHLGNLLAVIHGDGGHYQSEHGTAKAASDAEGWCIAERQALEDAERKLAEACTHCGGPEDTDKDCMCGGSGKRVVQIKGLEGCIQHWRKEHREVKEQFAAHIRLHDDAVLKLSGERDSLRWKLADTEQLFESYRINAAHAAKLDREALEQDLAETKTALVKMGQVLTESMASEDELEQERDSLKAQMEGAFVCQECGGASTIETAPAGAGHADDLAEYQKCPARKAGIVWPQEVKGG